MAEDGGDREVGELREQLVEMTRQAEERGARVEVLEGENRELERRALEVRHRLLPRRGADVVSMSRRRPN